MRNVIFPLKPDKNWLEKEESQNMTGISTLFLRHFSTLSYAREGRHLQRSQNIIQNKLFMRYNQCNKPPCNSTYTAVVKYLHTTVATYMSFKNCKDRAVI